MSTLVIWTAIFTDRTQPGISEKPWLWTKPHTSLASHGEDIPINKFCADNLLDCTAEAVFVTSRDCRDISEADAEEYILGYTCGNNLSSRLYQTPGNNGMQYLQAGAFVKSAPIGPILVHPKGVRGSRGLRMTTKINGQIVKDVEIMGDSAFSPERILSWASQGTTIPGGTAFMIGAPVSVQAAEDPRRTLNDGDVVDVEIDKIGRLRNKIVFQ